ncbi:MAG: hypothetical protein ACF8TS_04715, partial [Maioricimonas sp. JB049]
PVPLPKLWLIDRLQAPVIRPLSRLLVGQIAVPLFRLFRTRVLRLHELDQELEKDFEQWFRASLLLLAASKNVELQLAEWSSVNFNLDIDQWYVTLGRLMLAISVIEAMPDQELFAIIHPGPPPLKYERDKGLWTCCREQCWPYIRGWFFRHLNRSSPVLAIMAVIFGGLPEEGGWEYALGWTFYFLAIAQYLIIGLITSRDKMVDVLAEFDREVARRRRELVDEIDDSSGVAPQGAPSPAAASPHPTFEPTDVPPRPTTPASDIAKPQPGR